MRNKFGQLGPALIILVLLGIVVLASIGVDIVHLSLVRNQLQNAADAAALAGARDLWFNVQEAPNNAILIAAAHHADGKSVSNNTPGVTVSVVVTAPTQEKPGTVQVDITKRVNHLLAKVIGRDSDEITVRAIAGTSGLMWRIAAGQLFPMAVSIDAVPDVPNGAPLSSYSIGQSFTIYLAAQKAKNGGYTSFTNEPASAAYIKDAIASAMGLSEQPPGFIPSVALGDVIHLNNGNFGQQVITKDPGNSALKALPFIILPVIKGDPALNKPTPVVGFIAMKVTDIKKNDKETQGVVDSITGTLMKPQVSGESGPIPLTGSPVDDKAISRLQLGPIQLLQ